jgi:Zn-finger nucleic acid-binding protein
MEPFRYGQGDRQVERCTHCQGIWFKPSDVRRLKNSFHAEIIDRGDASVGREYNKVEEVDCPVCGTRLDKICDEQQTHIWYEQCPEGCGVYFDAGEFRDWKDETVMDIFRGWMAKIRR